MLWGEWTNYFPLVYEAHRSKNREARASRANRNTCRVQPASESYLSADEKASFATRARERAASRQSLEQLRLAQGFVWPGGFVGGRLEYRRGAIVYPGLVSNEAAILKLFVTKTPRARALRTGKHKAEASGTDSKLLALDDAYVETCKSMRGVLRVELDTKWPSWDALRTAIASCGVPQPSIVVAYQDPRGQVYRPHLLWLLAGSVCFTDEGNKRPRSAWKNTLRGLTARLLPIGADPGGITNPHRHKNPLSPLWYRRIFAAEPYVLAPDRRPGIAPHAALRPYMPTTEKAAEALRRAVEAAQGAANVIADHPDPAIAAESNGVFRRLASFARKLVDRHRNVGAGSREEFDAEIAFEALALAPPGPRAERAALTRARSIADWTWTNFRTGKSAPALTPLARKERLADGARSAAKVKRAGTLDKIITAIQRLSSGGCKPTQAQVVSLVGKALRTVKRYWHEASTLVAEGDISLPIDKKAPPCPRPTERSRHSPVLPAEASCRYPEFWSAESREVVNFDSHSSLQGVARPWRTSPKNIRPIPERADLQMRYAPTANDALQTTTHKFRVVADDAASHGNFAVIRLLALPQARAASSWLECHRHDNVAPDR